MLDGKLSTFGHIVLTGSFWWVIPSPQLDSHKLYICIMVIDCTVGESCTVDIIAIRYNN